MSGFSNAIAQHETYKEILSTIRAGRFPFGVLGTRDAQGLPAPLAARVFE